MQYPQPIFTRMLLLLLAGGAGFLLNSCGADSKKEHPSDTASIQKVESVFPLWVRLGEAHEVIDLPLDTQFTVAELTRQTPFFDVFLTNRSGRKRLVTAYGLSILSADSAVVLFRNRAPADEILLFSPWEQKRVAIQPRLDSRAGVQWDSFYLCRFEVVFDDSSMIRSGYRTAAGIDLMVARSAYGPDLVDWMQAIELYRQPESSARDQGLRLLALSEIDSVYKRRYIEESLRSRDYYLSTAAAWCAATLGWDDMTADIQDRLYDLQTDSLASLVTAEVSQGRSQREIDALLSEAKDEWMETYCQALGRLGKPCRK